MKLDEAELCVRGAKEIDLGMKKRLLLCMLAIALFLVYGMAFAENMDSSEDVQIESVQEAEIVASYADETDEAEPEETEDEAVADSEEYVEDAEEADSEENVDAQVDSMEVVQDEEIEPPFVAPSGMLSNNHAFFFGGNDSVTIRSITFLDSTIGAPEKVWDASELRDGSVLGWVVRTDDKKPRSRWSYGIYDMYIAANGGVIAPVDCTKLFYGGFNLERIDFGTNFNTSYTQIMTGMFMECSKLKELNLSSFNTSNVVDMSEMFRQCMHLRMLNVRSFDTSNVVSMSSMFDCCSELEYVDISNFDTSSVETMSGMFAFCWNMRSLDLTNFNTSNVMDLGFMFQGCMRLESLDISSFDTSNCVIFWDMFSGCMTIKRLDISSLDTRLAQRMERMFAGCSRLNMLTLGENFDITIKESKYDTVFAGCKPGLRILGNAEQAKKVKGYAEEFVVLTRGDSGDAVREMQKLLKSHGYYKGNSVDGVFGGGTERALQEYQTAFCVSVTGVYDVDTSWSLSNVPGYEFFE